MNVAIEECITNVKYWPKLTMNFGLSHFEEETCMELRLTVQTVCGEREVTIKFPADEGSDLEELDYKRILELTEDCIREIFRDENKISRFS